MSGAVAGVLIVLYVAALVFTLVTHEHLFHTPAEDETAGVDAQARRRRAAPGHRAVALESELLVGSLEPALEALGLSELFVGLIVIPIIGNAAEHSSAVLFALRNKVDVTLEIAIGSSRRSPCSWRRSWCSSASRSAIPMDFVFSTFEVAAVGLATMLVTLISLDGGSNWLEGAQLMGAYVIMAVSFFFVEHL